jgi:hypothetical protein
MTVSDKHLICAILFDFLREHNIEEGAIKTREEIKKQGIRVQVLYII